MSLWYNPWTNSKIEESALFLMEYADSARKVTLDSANREQHMQKCKELYDNMPVRIQAYIRFLNDYSSEKSFAGWQVV